MKATDKLIVFQVRIIFFNHGVVIMLVINMNE